MTTASRLPRATSTLTLRRLGAAAFTVTVLAGGLSACGGGAADTTCGDFKGQSDSDKRDTIKSAIKDEGDLSSDEKDQIENASDSELDSVASIISSACDSESDSTKIKDINPDDVDPSTISSDIPTDIPTDLPS